MTKVAITKKRDGWHARGAGRRWGPHPTYRGLWATVVDDMVRLRVPWPVISTIRA